jgi:hypothetical protein
MNPETLTALSSPTPATEPVVKPRLLHLSNPAERQELDRLLCDPRVEVHDTLEDQLRELV